MLRSNQSKDNVVGRWSSQTKMTLSTYDFQNATRLTSAEVYNPMTRRGCSVGNLNRKRVGHTMCNNMVCGGEWVECQRDPKCTGDGCEICESQEGTCEKFDGISTFNLLPVKLIGERNYHLCWGLKSGDVKIQIGTVRC